MAGQLAVAAVVVTYNSGPIVLATLHALLDQTDPPRTVLVVDNASSDGTPARITDQFPGVRVHQRGTNGGYGAAVNTGAALLSHEDLDALLFMTHECRLAPAALSALSRALLSAPGVGVAGPLIRRSSNDTIWSVGGIIDSRTWNAAHRSELPDSSAALPTDWLDGCALLVRRDALRAVGAMSEDYFLYFEDVDFCLRMQEAGWISVVVPDAEAWQEPGAPTRRLLVRNHLLVVRRHGPARVLRRLLVSYLRQVSVRAPLSDPVLGGVLDFALRRPARESMYGRTAGGSLS